LDGSIHPLGSLRIHIHGIAYIVNYTMIWNTLLDLF
jgi:hypothetical protein